MKKKIWSLHVFIIGILLALFCFSHRHSYAEEVINPDCTHDGMIIYTCECGDTYSQKNADALGHNYKSSIVYPTCNEVGYTIYSCSCGDIYKDNYTEKLEHLFSDWVLTTSPTAEADGEETRSCICGITETRVYICEHIEIIEENIIPATCKSSGMTSKKCSLCSKIIEEYSIPMLSHDFTNWKTTKTATPDTTGEKVRNCINCEKVESVVIEFKMAGPNSIYIPAAGINVNYIVADFTQEAVDKYDVICNYTRLNQNNPIVLGHNTGSLKKLYNASIGSNIYFYVDGILHTYQIIVSERAIETEGRTEIQGLTTGYELLNEESIGGETLRLYTCYQDKELGKIRWIVCADKII